MLEPIQMHRGATAWTRLPTVIPGVDLVPDFVKELEAAVLPGHSPLLEPLTPPTRFKVEGIVALLISLRLLRDHLPLSITLVSGLWLQVRQSARWTNRLSKIRPTASLVIPSVKSYRRSPRETAPLCSERGLEFGPSMAGPDAAPLDRSLQRHRVDLRVLPLFLILSLWEGSCHIRAQWKRSFGSTTVLIGFFSATFSATSALTCQCPRA